VTAWDELKVVLVRLRDEQPGVLRGHPTLELDPGRVPPVPPFGIRLAPWAAATAAELRRQFGDDVELTVGALPYPPGARPRPRPAAAPLPGLLDSREVTVELDGPAVVRSGHTLRHSLLVRNLSGSELQIATNGQVTAAVVDPHTGEVVGGYSGAQGMPLKVFRAAPGGSTRVPLLIATASTMPRLGYMVPAGEWGIQVTLTLGTDPRDSPRRRTPILPLTVIA
jgi:hypothetical protein